MDNTHDTSFVDAFFALHHGLPRQGPGSDATTRHLLELAGPIPERPRALDLGCGPGRAALLLAAEAGARVTAVDLHQPFLDELKHAAAEQGLSDRIHTARHSIAELPYPDRSFDLVWAEGSAYTIDFDTALLSWRRLLAEDGVLVVTECEWATSTPAEETRAFWDRECPLRTREANIAAIRTAGYRVSGIFSLPDRDWFDEYYLPLAERVAAAESTEPGMARAVAATRAEIDLRRNHGEDYRYTGYVLRPDPGARTGGAGTALPVTTRAETPRDRPAIRHVNLAAFPTPEEADLVDALRADPGAWLPGLSLVAETPEGLVVGHALLTRCHVGDAPALALAPCAVLPAYQRRGVGSAVIRAALEAARVRGESLVLVLGHPGYYPRFGFVPASRHGIHAPFDVPDEAMLVLALGDDATLPEGPLRYPAPFGV